MCNLTEVVVRPTDTLDSLRHKVKVATILGTLQATLTNFRYLRKKWQRNCEEERLLGVSLTGICDNQQMMNAPSDWLNELREYAVEVNAEWSDKLGINQSTAITCVKPSGTVSQLVDSASGIHPRFAPYYIRRVRNDKKDPLSDFLIDQGVPYEQDVINKHTWVFAFPMESPDTAVTAGEMDAMSQLELWKTYARDWCEHKPSMTAYYRDDDFLRIGDWLWNNFDEVSGVSFLPYSDHTYAQAPYEEISQEKYYRLVSKMPTDIDWTKLGEYEQGDNTTSSQEMACTGGACEIV